jgi:glycosyltransferase involved in cell wall biosynthesis
MLDSVHFARWLKQFEDQELDFYILGSKKYRRIDPLLVSLSRNSPSAKYLHFRFQSFSMVSGYLDFAIFEIFKKISRTDIRKLVLTRVLKKLNFDFVHALELQGAGYLLSSVDRQLFSKSKVIVTNWGSDIYFFRQELKHKRLIERTLSYANYYSAECIRDYKLARELGFVGIELPCIPNAGGFDIKTISPQLSKPSSRHQILVKGYGNDFGRASMIIDLIPILAQKYPQFNFHIYSVTEDIAKLIEYLPVDVVCKIRVTTVKEKISHSEMMLEFKKSRIYVSCSVSDGISTSFLESLISGCYPIQTDTSCANEWIQRGAMASIIPLNSDVLLREVEKALDSEDLIDSAAVVNQNVARKYLSYNVIKKEALKFYN